MAAQLYWVYFQCCDVLHGRRAYTDLAQSLVSAWEKIVAEGEETVTTRCGDRFQAVPASSPRTPHRPGAET
ncbi:hypothetical protein [Pseudonocardia kunmingensis]|uniref:Uncharacterized protein n=1 Tax=Pseudonocardia kunmingensis TaxID=630975 RepID=A0A543DNT5_9PSEU|nr:hypothetical protein [Pseudonocardia kunmingensis]TQM10997.1 hypothetical protein FB558_3526 [Pseudonocardia kunmingensis]